MSNSTIHRPDIESLDIDPDTVAFACLQPRAAILTQGLHHAAGDFFGFKPKSQWWASKILTCQGGEDGGFRTTHRQWRPLWPHLSISAVEDYVTKLNRNLKTGQKLSGFNYVVIDSGESRRDENGDYRRLPTLYAVGDFWRLYRFAQEKAVVDNLLRLSRVDRLRRLTRLVEEWAEAHGCHKIERAAEAEEVKPATPSLPCKCACASCTACAAKPQPKQQRPTPGRIKQGITAAIDSLYDSGQSWVDLGLDAREYWRLISTGLESLETRMAAPPPPRVKLVGGQPK